MDRAEKILLRMKIIIIGDEGQQFLAKMLRKKGCSVVSIEAIDWPLLTNTLKPSDIVIYCPDCMANDYVNDCLQFLAIEHYVCIISNPNELSKQIPPSQTIRLKVPGDRSLIFHLWIKAGLGHIGIPKKMYPVKPEESTIPEIIAKAMYEYWDDFFISPIQYVLPFIFKD
jgi:hypothetical protein